MPRGALAKSVAPTTVPDRKSLRITVSVVHPARRRAPWAPRLAAALSFVLAVVIAVANSRGSDAGESKPLVHFATSTHIAAAQREFDLGMSSIYAFAPEDALAHFQVAGRLDGTFAMAFWGIALGAGPNVNVPYDLSRAAVGRAACAQAALLAKRGPAIERDLIAALAKRYSATSDAQVYGAQFDYARAMDVVARRHPTSVDILTLAAESFMDLQPLRMWRHDGSPEPYTTKTIAFLAGALARDPGHIGANHYLIHAYERSRTPERALASARRLAALHLEPIDEHLAHMPVHIFLRLGLTGDAIGAGERSVALFRKLLREPHASEHDGYFHHDLQVLEAAYAMAGDWTHTRATATEVAAQVNDDEAAVDAYARFHRWHELLGLRSPERPGVRWHFARGFAQSETGDRDGAATESRTLHDATGDDARLTIARDVLDASIARRARDERRAIALLQAAVVAQDSLDLAEPPKWYAPVRESLGARYFEARRYADARRTFDADLARNPGNPRSLFGRAQTLRALHDPQAPVAEAAFRHAWTRGDSRLSFDQL